ncbi:flavodoxin domain-containing protein [Puniceicoccaceae bacterium K14]|nr:flavodoxin domain-containing protein [Puniceicoccaceae bacterium K14]
MNSQNFVPCIPENAPFSTDQISWLNGFLAGLYSNQSIEGGLNGESAALEVRPITILWGSQTGNTEGLAKDTAKALKAKGFAPSVVDMGDYDKSLLKDEGLLLLMTSTYGDGEAPDNAAELYDWILSEDAPRLEKLKYSVLALGDTNYPDFCKCGIDFDLRFEALGATRIAPRMDCDADFEESYESWISSVDSALGAVAEAIEAPAASEEEAAPTYGKKNPFPAKILDNYNLNGEGSSKVTRHVAFSIEGSGLSYESGDALAVLPRNCPSYANDFIVAAGVDSGATVEGKPLIDVLCDGFDITNLSPKTLKAYAALAKTEALDKLIEDKDALSEYSWGRQLIDVLIDFPFTFESVEQLLSVLPKLAPRLYSISSSPNAHKGEVHVTVGVVQFDAHGRERKGVCSSFLARETVGAEVKVYFHASKTFKLPQNNDLPVIMVGPGTGIAPFRSFLEERKARGAQGKNWLFFGDQHASCDFLYSNELDAYLKDGTLSKLDTAFSRDQNEKIYVQNRMIESGAELYEWLEEGACFYVCGDASRMAKDVDAALHKVIAVNGGLSESEAADYVKRLKSDKRYLRDVY